MKKEIGIGIRVYSNKKIFYSIIEETSDSINFISIDKIIIPLAINVPERLNYIKNTLTDIISEYEINTALVRVREKTDFGVYPITDNDIERFYIEGVLLESIAGSTVSKYKLGRIPNISPLIEIKSEDFKKFASGEKNYENIPEDLDWSSLGKEERESIFACLASLKL